MDEWERNGKSLETKLFRGRCSKHFSVWGLAIKEESNVRMLLVDAVNSSSSSSEFHNVSKRVFTFSSGKKLTSVSAKGTNAAAATALTYSHTFINNQSLTREVLTESKPILLEIFLF